MSDTTDPIKPGPKKRGRKPKGGKILNKNEKITHNNTVISNVILHLKCKLSDLKEHFTENIKYHPSIQNIEGTSTTCYKPNELSYQIINTKNNIEDDAKNIDDKKNIDIKLTKSENKDLYNKLKHIQYSLHINNLSNKKSNCFWCTCSFDNPVIYIPKSYIQNKYNVYGNFCSPECAVAHLFNEDIDSSTKFEQYNLFNHIYSEIYGYKKNIKPAPNPYYLLDKFMGNLTISEFRKLSCQEQLLFIMDKPITKIYPEIIDDNDDFLLKQYINKDSTTTKQKTNKVF